MSAPDISVHSLHINIGTGDSAIHLLVDLTTAGRPTVLRACLIDGGECQESVKAIKTTIDKIKERYTVPTSHNDPAAGIMRFDSVVITHWDTDHYKGIVLLMKDDFERQLQDIWKTTSDKKKVEEKLREAGCRYFRYGPTGKSELLTTMYAPYWKGDGKNNRKGTIAGPTDRANEFLETNPLTFKFDRGKRPKGKIISANFEIPNLCKVFTDAEKMMGMNFLNNEAPDSLTMDYKVIKSPGALEEHVKITDGLPVGIYCIACCGVVMGHSARIGSFMEKTPFDMTVSYMADELAPD